MPILVCMGLGMLARKKALLTQEQTKGIQQFVLKFCVPCVLFNSCLQSQLGAQSLTTMAMLLPVLLLSSLWAFHAGKRGCATTICPCFLQPMRPACWDFPCA